MDAPPPPPPPPTPPNIRCVRRKNMSAKLTELTTTISIKMYVFTNMLELTKMILQCMQVSTTFTFE